MADSNLKAEAWFKSIGMGIQVNIDLDPKSQDQRYNLARLALEILRKADVSYTLDQTTQLDKWVFQR